MYEIRIFTQFGTVLKSDWPTMGTALKHLAQYSSASSCIIRTPAGKYHHHYNEKRGK